MQRDLVASFNFAPSPYIIPFAPLNYSRSIYDMLRESDLSSIFHHYFLERDRGNFKMNKLLKESNSKKRFSKGKDEIEDSIGVFKFEI